MFQCGVLYIQKVELYRTCIHDAKRVNYELTRKCVDRLLFLGQVRFFAGVMVTCVRNDCILSECYLQLDFI